MTILKGNNNNKWWQGCSEKGSLIHCLWECKLVQSLWKTVWRFLKKLKIKLPYDPVILFLGSYPKEHKSTHNRDTCTPVFITAKLWEQPRCPTADEWIKKLWYIHTMEFYSAISFKGR
jgi:hypothetical protein